MEDQESSSFALFVVGSWSLKWSIIMSTYEIDFSVPSSMRGRPAIIWRMVSRLARRVMQRIQIRRAIAQLENLDDQLLRDIGIHRSEIRAVVTEGQSGFIVRQF